MINLDEYKSLYLESAWDVLQNLRKDMQDLPQKSEDEEYLKELRRLAHSVKSQSLVMNYLKTASLASVIENVFCELRVKKLPLTENLLSLVNSSINKLEESLIKIEKYGYEANLNESIENLEKSTGIKSSIKI